MADDPVELALQKSCNTRMRAAAAVTALIGTRFYDGVPSRPTFPYARMNPPQVVDEKNSASAMKEVFFEIRVFSRKRGRVEVGRIVKAILGEMETDLTPTGFGVAYQNHVDTRYMDEPDGLTQSAVIRFEIMTYPTA